MNKSTITKERLEKIVSDPMINQGSEFAMMARMALAATDGEPYCKERKLFCSTDTARMRKVISVSAGTGDARLYRHAQHPVVPDDVLAALQKVARIRLDLNDFDGDRRGIADCLGDAEEALIEVVNRRAAMLSTSQQSSGRDHATVPGKWIPVSEQKPACWCRTCRPVVLNDMRFVVCPDCGNKRCPRANDHRNACTGSNEPGQEGSAYPDTLQEPKP